MTALKSMKNIMSALKIYDIKEGSNIYNELCCYSVALDTHREILQQVLEERFIATASRYGIDNREILCGNVKTDYSIEKRREMLLSRNSLGENDFTLSGLEKILKSFGVTDYQVTENHSNYQVYIYIGGDYSQAEKKWIEKEILKILPAHLYGYVYFESINWLDIENKNLTFGEMDSRNYSWKEINSLKKEV